MGTERIFTDIAQVDSWGLSRLTQIPGRVKLHVEVDEHHTASPPCNAKFKKVGRFVRQPTHMICSKLSAYVGDARLGICLGRGRWLRRQLKHRCLLTLT
jgi:hypothetical protein